MTVEICQSTKYYDGEISKSRTVSVMMDGSILYIRDHNGQEIAAWSRNTLYIHEHPEAPLDGVIGCTQSPNARLHINTDKGWKYLKSRIPKQSHRGRKIPIRWASLFGYAAISIASAIFLFTIFPRLIGTFSYFIPLSWEKTMGKHAMISMIGENDICSAPSGIDALRTVLTKIKPHMNRDIRYHIRIVDGGELENAFAAPGGYLIIYKAVLDNAGSPEEFAGVLAHEMSHIDQRHSTTGMIRDMGMGVVLSLVLGNTGQIENLAKVVSAMSYSRDDETAADMHAKQVLTAANINPKGLQDFLIRVEQKETDFDFKGKEYLEYISSHPNTAARIKALDDQSDRNWAPALNQKDWDALRNICAEKHPIR